jgi:CCR4-NOT transcription complex subunit 1
VLLRDLDAVMNQLPVQSLSLLPPNHDIRHLVRQILYIASEAADRHRTPLLISQKIVQLLFKAQSQLGRDIYVAVLESLCATFDDVGKEAITWLLYAEDDVSGSRFVFSYLA